MQPKQVCCTAGATATAHLGEIQITVLSKALELRGIDFGLRGNQAARPAAHLACICPASAAAMASRYFLGCGSSVCSSTRLTCGSSCAGASTSPDCRWVLTAASAANCSSWRACSYSKGV